MRVGARGLAVTIVMVVQALLLGCRPSPSAPPQSAPAPTHAGVRVPDAEPGEGPTPDAPPSADLPSTCTMELEVLVPSATGHGASKKRLDEAKQAAWVEACARLRTAVDLDCHDRERVGVVSERSSSSVSSSGKVLEAFEYDVVLGARRTAEGFGDAPGDRQEACRRAKAHACEQLVAGPCPAASSVRVISVDGKHPNAAAVEPVAPTSKPRDTI